MRSAWLAAAAVTVLAGGYLFVRHADTHRQRARDTWAARLEAVAADRELAIDHWIQAGLADAETIALYPTLDFVLGGRGPRNFPVEEGAEKHLDELLRRAVKRQGYAAVAVLDPSPGTIAMQGDIPSGFGEAVGRLARRVAASRSATVDVLGATDVPFYVLFAAPVPRGGEGVHLGTVVLAARPDEFFLPLLRAKPIIPSGSAEVMLARREGDEAVFLNPARFHPGGPLTLRRSLDSPGFAMKTALAGEAAFGDFVDYRGVPVLAATRRLSTAPWGLVAKVDREEAYAAERSDGLMEGAALLGTILAAAGLGLGLWRYQEGAADAALQAAGARSTALLEHANDAILLVTPGGRILEANRRAAELYGITREGLVGRSVLELHVEDERAGARRHQVVEQLQRDGSIVYEARHLDASGRPFPVEVSSRLVDLADGPTVVSIVRDVRERKEQEARILALTRLYRTLSQVNRLLLREPDRLTLFEGLCHILTDAGGFPLAMIAERSDDGRIRPVAYDGPSAGYARGLDVRWDETPLGGGPGGQALREGRGVVVADLAADPAFAPWAERAREHGLGTMGAFPVAEVAVLAVYGARPGEIGDAERDLLKELARDVGQALENLEAKRDRREARAALEAFFRSNAAGIVFGTVDGQIQEANDAFLRMVGYSREELERGEVRWVDLTPPEHLPRDGAAIAEAKEKGACTAYEKEYVRKDGRRIWVLVGFTLLEPGRERSVAFIHEVTAQREAEEEIRRLNAELESRVGERTAQLELANADLEAFSCSVSHDLRAPLRAIDDFARALEEEHAGGLDGEGARLVVGVREGAARMGRLIEGLLAFSHAGSGELELTRVEMETLAREAFEELASHEEIEGLELRLARLDPAHGDPRVLRQVWLNLLSNAVKFTRGRSPRLIDVTSERDGREVRYVVRDSGIGFDPRHANRLFQAFTRLHSTDQYPGAGIGLAIVRRIVARHGGRVGAEGRPGEGAILWFTLPRVPGG